MRIVVPRITARSILLYGHETARHGVESFQRGLWHVEPQRSQKAVERKWRLACDQFDRLAQVGVPGDDAAHPAKIDCDGF